MLAVEDPKLSNPVFALMLLFLFMLPMWRVGYYDVTMFRDDAGVVFVYARNLVETGQIFYNFPADRLDGFTSFVDVLFAVPLYLMAPDSMFVWNYYIKGLIASLVPILVFLLFIRWGISWRIGFVLAAVLASSDVLASAFGMQLEGPLYAACIVAFFACLFDRQRDRTAGLAAIGLLLCLTRPEAIALVAGAFALTFCFDADRQRRRSAIYAGVSVLSVMLAWFGWRIWYFGYWAPNTYYAKLSGSRLQELSDGFDFVFYQFLNRTDVFLYAAFFALLIWSGRLIMRAERSSRETDCLITAFVAFGMLAVRIWSGGDSYKISGRLLIDFAIPAVLSLGLGLAVCKHIYMRYLLIGLVVMTLLANGLHLARNMPRNLAAGFIFSEREINATLVCEHEALDLVTARWPGARLAHTDFQRAKYYAPNLEVMDLSGLNNRDIAHRTDGRANLYGKHDLQYGLDKQVEMWKFSSGVMDRTPLHELDWSQALRTGDGLRDRFKKSLNFLQGNYDTFSTAYAPLTVKTKCGNFLNLIVRRDLLNGADSVYLETG